jgi:hypothetical protein
MSFIHENPQISEGSTGSLSSSIRRRSQLSRTSRTKISDTNRNSVGYQNKSSNGRNKVTTIENCSSLIAVHCQRLYRGWRARMWIVAARYMQLIAYVTLIQRCYRRYRLGIYLRPKRSIDVLSDSHLENWDAVATGNGTFEERMFVWRKVLELRRAYPKFSTELCLRALLVTEGDLQRALVIIAYPEFYMNFKTAPPLPPHIRNCFLPLLVGGTTFISQADSDFTPHLGGLGPNGEAGGASRKRADASRMGPGGRHSFLPAREGKGSIRQQELRRAVSRCVYLLLRLALVLVLVLFSTVVLRSYHIIYAIYAYARFLFLFSPLLHYPEN